MQKKLVFVLIILIIAIFAAANAFANPGDDTASGAGYAGENGEDSSGEIEGDENEENDEISPWEIYLQEIIKSVDIEETEQFLVTLTEPKKENSPIIFEKMNICGFLINGKTNPGETVIVILARYNDETGLYEELENTEGESRLKIGLFGLFAKEVRLPVGINRLKITICKIPEEIVKLLNLDGKNEGNNAGEDALEGADEDAGENDALAENGTGNRDDQQDEQDETGAEAAEAEPGETEAEAIIRLEAGKDLQVNFFTIKVHDEATRDKLVNKKVNISDIFNNIIVPK